ncbi:CBN-NLP-23 protein [Caenorhabditis brenneri]|uniref:CBN-NLP-23 protein n=1 Tax=Caenorhabditis brenneri TaxID=135651 RepID=G0M776_CAEBE|nr:CBN-NLP-23 protein [Caenorhabditis brenneri]
MLTPFVFLLVVFGASPFVFNPDFNKGFIKPGKGFDGIAAQSAFRHKRAAQLSSMKGLDVSEEPGKEILEDEWLAMELPSPSEDAAIMEKRLYINRDGFRPAKRSMAIGRAGMRPGKRAFGSMSAGGRRMGWFADNAPTLDRFANFYD